jgi:MFS family permease
VTMTASVNWFLSFRFFSTVAMQMKMTILGYFLYQISGEALVLGLLGLYEALPRILTALPAGFLVERMEKRKALLWVVFFYILLSIALFFSVKLYRNDKELVEKLIFGIVFLMGLTGSTGASASITLFSSLVQKENMPKFSAINSSAWQIGAIIGSILGGFLYGIFGVENSILIIIGLLSIGFISILPLPKSYSQNTCIFSIENTIAEIKEGLHFVYNSKVMLWAISLDLFAVLFGGCVALLPIFAKDILLVDETKYGMLRAAMSIGSAVSLLILARRPIQKNTGKWLLVFVALFGLMTIGFAFSKIFILSMIFLFLMGAFDAVSVVIRSALLLMETPDNMRARVSSVNSMFISSSNEIGAFESGFAAQYMGTVRSVVFGGSMTLLFVSIAWFKAKELVKYEFKK